VGGERETANVRISAVIGWGCMCPLGEGKSLFLWARPRVSDCEIRLK
jgi:hypothetical protein